MNAVRDAVHEEAGRNLATALIASDVDYVEVAEAIGGNVPEPMWRGFCAALDICPTHSCDVEICRDDQDPECEAGREAAAESGDDGSWLTDALNREAEEQSLGRPLFPNEY